MSALVGFSATVHRFYVDLALEVLDNAHKDLGLATGEVFQNAVFGRHIELHFVSMAQPLSECGAHSCYGWEVCGVRRIVETRSKVDVGSREQR